MRSVERIPLSKAATTSLSSFLFFLLILLRAPIQGLKEDSQSSAKHYEKHTKDFPVPLREHDQFDTSDRGFQHALSGISAHTRTIAHIHSELANSIETSVLSPLKALGKEIGDHIKAIDDDLGQTFSGVDTEREQSTNAVSEYTKGVNLSTAGEGHSAHTVMNDPWVAHRVAEHQLHKHLDMENHLTQSTIHWQSTSKNFEARVISTTQEAAAAFTRATVNTQNRLRDEWTSIENLLTRISPTGAHWLRSYSSRNIARRKLTFARACHP